MRRVKNGLMLSVAVWFFTLPLLSPVSAFDRKNTPLCLVAGETRPLSINNSMVLQWKNSTPDQFQARAHVEGTTVKILVLRPSHIQFEMKIGPGAEDSIEIVYNRQFGELPQIVPGMQAEICGDYITTNRSSNSSPTGAIIHWVHQSNNLKKHESGYVSLNNTLYGIK